MTNYSENSCHMHASILKVQGYFHPIELPRRGIETDTELSLTRSAISQIWSNGASS